MAESDFDDDFYDDDDFIYYEDGPLNNVVRWLFALP